MAFAPADAFQRASLDGSMGWKHLSSALTPSTTMRFASGGNSFDVDGAPLARDAFVYDASVGMNVTPYATLALTYQGQLATEVQEQIIGGKFSYRF